MRFFLSVIILLASLAAQAQSAQPKREFRGAWLHTVFQGQYKAQTTAQNKAYLIRQLDSLQAMGVNAVIFQVRPQADAFYASELEPWSVYLTNGGKAPVPYWDPLEFMVEESHKRGMELHAWLNPYRITSNTKQSKSLPANHIARKYPSRCLEYGGKMYFDPGLPENREFIGKVVDDIVARYDIDGIHFDDYFYPYPVPGKQFPDDKSFARYGKGMKRADWRRKNVDILIEDINRRIKAAKPWVRFGVSPFGIYRNKKTDPNGSDTNGLENYDALYADVLLWEREGWVDYLMPQLYCELEHKSASYLVLVEWWNKMAGASRHLYIGQDVARTMDKADIAPSKERNQLKTKIEHTRRLPNIQGNCWWPGYALTRNHGKVADALAGDFQSQPALAPACPWLSAVLPAPVEGLRPASENSFKWKAAERKGAATDVMKYAVYRFESRVEIDIEREGALVAVTAQPEFTASQPGVYVVTAVDRVNNESEPSAPIVVQ